MKNAKLIDGYPSYAPNPILHNGVRIGNPPPEIYLEQGYKPVVYNTQPKPQGVGWWVETWTETAEAIVQGWSWHEAGPEDEISSEDALVVLIGGGGT